MRRSPVTWALAAAFLLAMVLPVPLWLDAPSLPGLLFCHLTHTSWEQLLFAGGTTLVLAWACERAVGSRRLLASLGLSALGVSTCVLLTEASRLSWYVGSSGLGHALAAVWALRAAPVGGRGKALLCAGLLVKVVLEAITGSVAFNAGLAGATPVPAAHGAGVFLGGAFGLLSAYRLGDRAAEQRPHPEGDERQEDHAQEAAHAICQ